jgi:Ca-activated chloride channel family protein
MKFLDPHWLWGLVCILPLMAMLFWDERLRKLRFARFAAEATWKFLAPDLDFSARVRKGILWLLSFAFVLIALARPQWGTHEETSKLSGLDVMLVLDISNSMQVEDIVPNRLQKAKHEIRSLVDRLQGDRVGVVAFAASAQVSCPLTTDLSYLLDMVQILDPKLATSQGTDIGLGLETARKSIERGAEDANAPPGGEAPPTAQSSQAIVLISDGEDQEDSALEVAKKLKETGVKLYVIGVGSQKGGPIPVRDENGNLVGYKKDRQQKSVVSQFKPDALAQLAAAAGGHYWSATDNENEVEELIQDLGAMHRAEFAERRYVVFEDRFQIPLLIAVLLMLLEIALPTRKRSASAALNMGAVILLLVLSPPKNSQAADSAPLRAYLENEKGIASLKDGKADDAKREFGTAQAIAPTLPELEFNQGVVQLNQGDADAAIQSFGEATKKSSGKDPEFAAKSLFNLGVAQTKKGDFKGAVKSYLAAIDQSESTKDKEVGAAARKNLELLNQEQKKQQQQKKDDQQKKDQEQKQQQQQKDQQDQKDKDKKDQQQKNDQQKKQDQDQDKDKKDSEKSKDQEQSKPGKEQYEEPKNQQFKSQKLTPDDADRVMEELKHREKELQTKLNKKTNTRDSVNDW